MICKECNNESVLRDLRLDDLNGEDTHAHLEFCDYCNYPVESQTQIRSKIDPNFLKGKPFKFRFEFNHPPKVTQATYEENKHYAEFSSVAIEEYLAARTLLLNNQIIVGTILACSSLEKFFKAFLSFQKIKNNFNHDPSKVYKTIRSKDDSFPAFNVWFLEYLAKAYKFRYRESRGENFFEPGMKFYFSKFQTLAELDFTVDKLSKVLTINESKEKFSKTNKFSYDLRSNPLLYRPENIMFSPYNRNYELYFSERLDKVIEFYIDAKGFFRESQYSVKAERKSNFLSTAKEIPSVEANKLSEIKLTFTNPGLENKFINSTHYAPLGR